MWMQPIFHIVFAICRMLLSVRNHKFMLTLSVNMPEKKVVIRGGEWKLRLQT